MHWWQKQHIKGHSQLYVYWVIQLESIHPEIFHIAPNYSQWDTVRETFLTVSVLRRSVSSLGQDFQLGSQWGARSQWVGVFLYCGYAHMHTQSTPVMLGRFQPAASEGSALEFVRPKEISNWVMDMVTWTMRRQKERERGEEGKRESEGMKHNMSSLSFSPPHAWPWLQRPKTNLSWN